MPGTGPVNRAVADVMRRERDQREWRQADLADRLGWPLSRVTRIEAGTQRVLVQDLLSLCRVLELTLGDLLGDLPPIDLKALRLPDPPDPSGDEKPERT